MRDRIPTRVVAAVAAAGAVVGLVAASPAAFAASSPSDAGSTTPTTQASNPACTPGTFSQAQQRVEAALSARVTQLNALLGAVNNTADKLTATDRQTLSTDINQTELPGIQG